MRTGDGTAFGMHIGRAAALLVVATVVFGTGDPASGAITNSDFTDATGTIQVRVKTCNTSTSNFTNCVYCVLDEGWTMVGGGAQLQTAGTGSAKARLQASFPSPDGADTVDSFGCKGPADPNPSTYSTWIVRSSGATHTVTPYVMGIRVRATPSSSFFAPATSNPTDNVVDIIGSTATQLSSEDLLGPYTLVGGGAEIFAVDSHRPNEVTNAYLSESIPVEDPVQLRAWSATAKTENTSTVEHMKVWSIGIDLCPVGAGWCFTYPMIRTTSVTSQSGYGTATYALPPSWVATSIGGNAPTSSGGPRFLTDLIPLNGTAMGSTVRSYHGNAAASGPTDGVHLVVGQADAPYTYNAVRFNANVTALARPTGTNPRLQQSTQYPDAPALHWYLEILGGGIYRLRNGNPDSGTECAYRETGTTNVRITTCGTGNEFKWTLYTGSTNGTFQLRNVAANQCMDNNGQGFVTGNLLLKNCSSGSSAQQMFLDAFSWPP